MGSHQTAISRKKLSTPAQYLRDQSLIVGRGLDYGCGKGFDADTLCLDGYDPYFRPQFPTGRYDTILCTYVLNVIESAAERLQVLNNISNLLTPNGVAYITVRNDVKKDGPTSKGWQGTISLPYPVLRKTSGYIIYEMRK
jgi:hypothetical protein